MSSDGGLRRRVLSFVHSSQTTFSSPTDDSDTFQSLALDAFQHQFSLNSPYQRYCQRRAATPESVLDWSQIPAVPTDAFKEAALICGRPEEAEIVFRTSGTTRGVGKRGAHYVRDLSLYRSSALVNFECHFLPERLPVRMLILGPSPELAPDSSLAWMLDLVRQEWGTDDSEYLIAEQGFLAEAALTALERSQRAGVPVALLGTAAAFVRLLEALAESGRRFQLPPGSRAMETGGFKVRGSEIPRESFYADLIAALGLSPFYCIAEYGMTEMCSQFYDNVLREHSLARAPRQRLKVVPPWVRTQVVDPESLKPMPEGKVGILRHFDLANLDSVSAIQTEDLGLAVAGGFEIMGRATGSELRGCSIAIDEWLAAQRD